jgi:hypothetical protein
MSRRDGHEWEELGSEHPETMCDCCTLTARWAKVLYAADKSTYHGGFYCNLCKKDDEEGLLA